MDNKNKYNPLIKIIILFIIFFIIGYIIGLRGEKQNVNLGNMNSLNSFISFVKIMGRNTIAFILLFSSIILGEKLIYFFYGLNAYLIGMVVAKINSLLSVIIIVPHGIFEIASFILTGYFLISYINTKNLRYIKLARITYLGILFAAFIESFITPKLILLVLG